MSTEHSIAKASFVKESLNKEKEPDKAMHTSAYALLVVELSCYNHTHRRMWHSLEPQPQEWLPDAIYLEIDPFKHITIKVTKANEVSDNVGGFHIADHAVKTLFINKFLPVNNKVAGLIEVNVFNIEEVLENCAAWSYSEYTNHAYQDDELKYDEATFIRLTGPFVARTHVDATEKNTKATQKPNREVEQWYARPLHL
ncbi:hypothetical protein DAEQUDRAFT_767000 [Daedalea quercina L-15889]|uniref:Uncharacterized protein n=1 Tax=Daedalea quercina L-15889 TaxID=1314783 RepID=A0A165P1C0_9APHY|nr:hypothetical protein DAEQUDRAFT_767000 [Daedalea quercina L-15889]